MAGKIPDGGGWRIHGRDCDQARQANRAKKGQKVGYTYFHSAIDGFSRLAYTEALPDEKATTVIGFWARARAWFSLHGIGRITRLVTDNGPCYKAHAFERSIAGHVAKHQYIRAYTPRHNRKVERYNRILAEEIPLRPTVHLRRPTQRSHQGLERPLQLPSDPHRLREPATSHPHPSPRHERDDLKHLAFPTVN